MIEKGIILLPKDDIDLQKFACVACDQFTSNIRYWEKLREFTKGSVTTLDFILPEAYLQKDNSELIEKINASMQQSIDAEVFKEVEGCIFVVRQSQNFERRLGLVALLDLKEYSFNASDKSLVRATEGTVLERIPPRVEIRQNAPLEFPHIMVLFDDKDDLLMQELYANRDKYKKCYDFELNFGGGHIQGYQITDCSGIKKYFDGLLSDELLEQKYASKDRLLFAVGDGNHSLATAKTIWERAKKTLSKEEQKDHPLRYALVEFVNIYDSGIKFEPIHRFVKTANNQEFLQRLIAKLKEHSGTGEITIQTKSASIEIQVPKDTAECYRVVQEFLDGEKGIFIDYIHGEKELKQLVEDENGIGIFMPALSKDDLFCYIIKNGVLPRKTFSMGEAEDKRYYLEGRKIKL